MPAAQVHWYQEDLELMTVEAEVWSFLCLGEGAVVVLVVEADLRAALEVLHNAHVVDIHSPKEFDTIIVTNRFT